MNGLHVESLGNGPPAVLLHGWAMHGGVFAPIIAPLAKRFRVHVVDLPGHGHSAPIERFTLETVAAAIAARFGHEVERVTLIGWSLGALVAMAWVLALRDPIERLVLVGATPRFVTADDWPHAMDAQTLARFHDELRVAYRLTLGRFLALQVRGSEHGRAALAALRAQLFARGEPSPAVLQAGLDVLATTDFRSRVHSIDVPTLVVSGDRDAMTPSEAGAWLATMLPNARLACIEGAAHAPFLSHPHEFNAALDGFLDGR